jgi:hypothetical protein
MDAETKPTRWPLMNAAIVSPVVRQIAEEVLSP